MNTCNWEQSSRSPGASTSPPWASRAVHLRQVEEGPALEHQQPKQFPKLSRGEESPGNLLKTDAWASL